jgi:cytoskeleton protein RodZ
MTSTSVGMTLRAAREHLAWPLATVADRLRIRLRYLEALEAGQTSLLPPAYILGFLRAYSQALDLDPEEMVRCLKAEAGELTQHPTLAFPTSVPDRGIPSGAIMLLGLILTVGAFAGWHRLSGEGLLPAETVAQIPQRLAPLAEQAIRPGPGAVGVAVDTHSAVPVIGLPAEPGPAPPAVALDSVAAQAHQSAAGIPWAASSVFVAAPLEDHLELPRTAPEDDMPIQLGARSRGSR